MANPKRLLLQRLESLQRAGVEVIPRVPEVASSSPGPTPSGTATPTENKPQPMSEDNKMTPSPASLPGNAEGLQVIAQDVAACTLCTELATTRTQTVFGVGNPNARLCFMGEAPGADEDKQGIPFVGRAGKLLTQIIEACTLSRDDVYILNTLKCRPPGNRNPSVTEAANCRGFLERQLEVIKPEYVCCLGAVAAQSLLETNVAIGKLRGRFHDFRDIKVLATYHPAYLLRNPSAKKDCWDDMKLLMRAMGLKIPAKKS